MTKRSGDPHTHPGAAGDEARPMRASLSRVVDRLRQTRSTLGLLQKKQVATRRAVTQLEDQVAAMGGLLLMTLTGTSLTQGDRVDSRVLERLVEVPLGPTEAATLVGILVDSGHPLAADELAQRFGIVQELRMRHWRALARELRSRGYLARAVAYTELVAAEGGPGDAFNLRMQRGDIDVLSGRFTPTVGPVAIDPVPGRVLHVVGYAIPQRQTGYTIRTNYTVRAQRGAGLDPHVVTQFGLGDVTQTLTEYVDGTPHHLLGKPDGQPLPLDQRLQRHTEELLSLVTRVRPSVLHAHSDFLNAITAQTVGSATGIPVVYESRGFWEESWLSRTADRFGWSDDAELSAYFGEPDVYAWRRDREAAARAAADHVVTLARVMRPRILSSGTDEARLSLAPNAVDSASFAQSGKDEALLARLGLDGDEVVIGYVSSLVEYEGIDTLIRAFATVRDEHEQPVRLLIVGEGQERTNLERVAEAVGSDAITFTGQVPHEDVELYYGVIDVFVVPRKPSDVCHLVTPLKPFEAMAAGKALVMSDVDALREIAEDSDAGVLFEAGSEKSLADVLARLVEDPGARLDLARRGRSWVAAHRTWEANAEVYAGIYAGLGALNGLDADAEQRSATGG
jgi:glycosyltransferase involved in cell wall biosynthesis